MGKKTGLSLTGFSNHSRQKVDPKILDVIPHNTGPRVATLRGGVVHATREPGAQVLQAQSHFAAVMLVPVPKNYAALGSDRMEEYDAPLGSLVIHPANVEGRARWSHTREMVIVAFRPEHLLDLAASEFNLGNVEFEPPAFGTIDIIALRNAQLLKAELAQGSGNELYIDSLITAFGIHLLRSYTTTQKSLSSVTGRLSNRAAERIRDYIDANFTKKVSVAELAAIAGLSPRHFILTFMNTFGRPPHQYLIERRLSFAEELLTKSDLSIAEIAYLSGFSNQSHLTTTMSKYRNRTPKQVRLQR